MVGFLLHSLRRAKRSLLVERAYKTGSVTYMGLRVPVSRAHVPAPIVGQLLRNDYERPEIRAALSLVRPGDRVLELGVGLGVVGALVARSHESVRLTSFEANPSLIPYIKDLHAINGVTSIDLQNRILLHRPDRPSVPFHVNRYFPEGSLIPSEGTVAQVEVMTADFDEVVRDVNPTVLVCDIEGGEAELLAPADLSSFRALIVEMHPHQVSAERLTAIVRAALDAGLLLRLDLLSGTVLSFERPPG
jgi:FkbM family methyltransferase